MSFFLLIFGPVGWAVQVVTDKGFISDIDFGDKKITVNAIAPGGIKTDMYDQVVRKYIPGEQSMSDEEVEKVSWLCSSPSLLFSGPSSSQCAQC